MTEIQDGEHGERKLLEITQDPDNGTVTIEGIRFSAEAMKALAHGETTIRFRFCPACGFNLDKVMM